MKIDRITTTYKTMRKGWCNLSFGGGGGGIPPLKPYKVRSRKGIIKGGEGFSDARNFKEIEREKSDRGC